LLGRLEGELRRFATIAADPMAVEIKDAEIVLRHWMPLGRSFAVPMDCIGVILRHAYSTVMEKPKEELGLWGLLFRGLARPVCRFIEVSWVSQAIILKERELKLRVAVPQGRGLVVPLQGLAVILVAIVLLRPLILNQSGPLLVRRVRPFGYSPACDNARDEKAPFGALASNDLTLAPAGRGSAVCRSTAVRTADSFQRHDPPYTRSGHRRVHPSPLNLLILVRSATAHEHPRSMGRPRPLITQR
jgi:hypothetical protein